MPSRETVRKAVAAIKRSADYAYFFDALQSPAWIEPLRAEGFFKKPPQAEREAEWIRFPVWPESRYLVRMAALAPEAVLAVLLDIPDTDNARVKDDVIEASLAMPPGLAVRLVPRAVSWIDETLWILLPIKLAELAARLAKAGLVSPAMELTVALLMPVSPTQSEDAQDAVYRRPPEPQPRYRAWDYGEVVKAVLPPLLEADAVGAIKLFGDLLQRAMAIRMGDDPPPRDSSYIWRSTVEDSGQNHRIDRVTDFLIEAVRDTAQDAVTNGRLLLSDVVAILESYPWQIFHRIALHLVRVNLDDSLALAKERVFDTARGEDIGQYHEYWLLVRDLFPKLDESDQEAVLNFILVGPSTTRGEDHERDARFWRLNRLAVLKDVLGPRWRPHYDGLVETMGFEPEHPEFLAYRTTWSGPRSPKEAADLLAMPVQEVVGFLRDWQPQPRDRFMGPSLEGLGRTLASAVSADPERFARAADLLRGLDPTYVRSAIQGWRDAIRERREFSWEPVLALCSWAVDQEPLQAAEPDDQDRDPSWQWTRRAIADLIGAGLEKSPCEIPIALRKAVWSTLEPLTRDSDPTPNHEEQYGGSNMDPPTLAINTTRGEAIHSTVRYGLWVYRSARTRTDQRLSDFESMPEVREILELHLRPSVEPSAAIRSAYGQWLPWLILLDERWTQDHLVDIFTDETGLEHLRAAAWNAYAMFCEPYDSAFDILRDEYRKALARLTQSPASTGNRAAAEERLAEHIIALFLRGRLGLDDELVVKLFAAPEDIREHAIAFVGRALREWQDLPDAVAERARRLWQLRRTSARVDEPGHRKELGAFGWWFISGKLDAAWILAQLVDVLRATKGQIDLDFSVIKRLAELAPQHPGAVVEAVRLIAEGDGEGWGLASSLDTVRTILIAALESSDPAEREAATALTHNLGARGYRDLRSVLPRKS